MTRYVVGFLFALDPDGVPNRVALIRKSHPEWQRGRLNGVGGHIEQGESSYQAMAREFQEETYVVTDIDEWTLFATVTGPDWEVDFYKAAMEHDDPRLSSIGVAELGGDTREEPVYLWPLGSQVPHAALPNLRWLIPLALDGDAGRAHVYDRAPNGQGQTKAANQV
jgi:8-oxo-dGTP diphosphatase